MPLFGGAFVAGAHVNGSDNLSGRLNLHMCCSWTLSTSDDGVS